MDVNEAMRVVQRAAEGGAFDDLLALPASGARGLALRKRVREFVGEAEEGISFNVAGGTFSWEPAERRRPASLCFYKIDRDGRLA